VAVSRARRIDPWRKPPGRLLPALVDGPRGSSSTLNCPAIYGTEAGLAGACVLPEQGRSGPGAGRRCLPVRGLRGGPGIPRDRPAACWINSGSPHWQRRRGTYTSSWSIVRRRCILGRNPG
jgi:hypothetical protein